MENVFEKYNKLNAHTKAVIWFAFCNILQKGISFITIPVFSRMLSTEEYGTYSLYLSWLGIITILTSLYLYNGVFNNAYVKYEKDIERYISSMQGLIITISVTIFVIYLMFIDKWTQIIGLPPIIMYLMFVEMIITPSFNYWSAKQRFEFKYKGLVIFTLIKSVANPVVGIIAVLMSSQKDVARIASVVLTEFVLCGCLFVYQFMKGKCYFDKKYWKYSLSFGITLLPHYLSSMILNHGDRIMIEKMVGRQEVALYSFAYNIGMMAQVVTYAIGNVYIPWLYKKLQKDNVTNVKETINKLLVVVALCILCIMLCCPEIIKILGPKEYAKSLCVIPPILASVYFIFLYNIISVFQFYYEKTNFMIYASITTTVINVFLNYIFIQKCGYVAAAYTTLVCYILYSIGHFVVSKKVVKEKNAVIFDKMIDRKLVLCISCFVIFATVITDYLLLYMYIRYAILLGLILVMFKSRKSIGTLINCCRDK